MKAQSACSCRGGQRQTHVLWTRVLSQLSICFTSFHLKSVCRFDGRLRLSGQDPAHKVEGTA